MDEVIPSVNKRGLTVQDSGKCGETGSVDSLWMNEKPLQSGQSLGE
jgi:hypothetical protein